jgi:hypothetical protein
MTIKEIAARTGLSQQAIYKRIKGHGIRIADLRDGKGGLTAEGEELLAELFNLDLPPRDPKPEETAPENPAQENQGDHQEQQESHEEPHDHQGNQGDQDQQEQPKEAGSDLEVALLRERIASLEAKVSALTEERDFLRVSLERSQQLQALTAAKIPNPPPAITDGSDQGDRDQDRPRGFFSWFRRGRHKKSEP